MSITEFSPLKSGVLILLRLVFLMVRSESPQLTKKKPFEVVLGDALLKEVPSMFTFERYEKINDL